MIVLVTEKEKMVKYMIKWKYNNGKIIHKLKYGKKLNNISIELDANEYHLKWE